MAAGFATLAAPALAGERMLSLERVAAESGFSYSWLAAERAAAIAKPGLTIVVRPGDRIYDVNDEVEAASTAPRALGQDILIPATLAARIETLGLNRVGRQPLPLPGVPFSTTPITGALSFTIAPAEGSEALTITGAGPATAPVTVTLYATLSSDIPTVVLSRHDLTIGSNGTFAATIPIASDFLRGSILTVRATSLDTVSPAQATLLVGAPNPHITVPAEQLPSAFKN